MDGALIDDPNIVMNECAGVLQYSQSVFEGLKAYTTEGRTYCYIPAGSECFPHGRFRKTSRNAAVPGGAFRRRCRAGC